MIPEPGEKFGPYEILGKLGGGAMGLVFRAWDPRLHREVAIKLLHDDYQMPGMRERFLQEARAASGLNHPNICTVFDLGEQDGDPYMVMELLEGETLKDKITRGAVPVDEIVMYAQEVADALAAAHAKGIVHRDIKPANIFVVDLPNGRRQTKVLDFGLAKIGLAMPGGKMSRTLDLTLAGATVGTLSYMSPEQARGQVLDERSDLFSLGVVMYEMATRQVPFKGATSALIFVQLLNHAPEPLHEWNDSISKDLERIILKLLSKDRTARFQKADELAKSLRKIPFRTNSGGWLKRSAKGVPLVRAADPIARARRPLRTDSSPGRRVKHMVIPEPVARVQPLLASRSADNTLIRPRLPQREAGARDEGVLRGDRRASERESSVAVSDSDEMPVAEQVLAIAALATEPVQAAPAPVVEPSRPAEATVEIKRQVEPAVETKKVVEPEVIPLPSRSGATQFEFGETSEHEVVHVAIPRAKMRETVKPLPGQRGKATLDEPDPEELAIQRRRMAIMAALLVVVLGAGFAAINSGRFRPVLLQPGDQMLLTVIQNKTDDKTLDGAATEALELALDQSQYMTVRGGEAYRAALRQVQAEGAGSGPTPGRKIAQMVGAKAYLYGEIRGTKPPYTISVDVLKTDSNDKLASIVEIAQDSEGIVPAIDRIARRVRTDMGEPQKRIAKESVGLEKEATSNMDALKAFVEGEDAAEKGRTADAITDFEKAQAADPKFSQAHLRLAWLYGSEKAEEAAAAEAKLALDGAQDAGQRTRLRTQFGYEMNASGDLSRAAAVLMQWKELYPRDEARTLAEAKLLLAEGHLSEALQAAQETYGENAYNSEAYIEAEVALLGMNRYQDVLALDAQAAKLGMTLNGRALAAAYLVGNRGALERQTMSIELMRAGAEARPEQTSYGQLADYGLYLDNEGRTAAGGAFWLKAAASVGGAQRLVSTRGYLLAQAALDRALAKSCGPAMEFARKADDVPAGPMATFNTGMAFALCGDKVGAEKAIAALKQSFPKSSAVTGYYVPGIEGALALANNDPKRALDALTGAGDYDPVSLTPYLRGLAHLRTGEPARAVADFQIIVDHRGAVFAGGSNVYPMAQMGLARGYEAMGDKMNSTTAYRRFTELWHQADPGQVALAETALRGL